MKEKLLMWLVSMFLERVGSDDLKKWVDAGLDIIENKVKESPGKTDDLVVLPMIHLLRTAFTIPDND